jgi:hypothetical protein
LKLVGNYIVNFGPHGSFIQPMSFNEFTFAPAFVVKEFLIRVEYED